ncbi:MAG: glycosyltransferase family 4 protein [Candidatus Hermodarchaeia archaeon]|jgi:glycosyltransferase involved in cell wall biosynthesis
MKIQFLLTQDLESPAGLGRYLPIAKALSQMGHTVVISALHSNYSELSDKNFEQGAVQVHYVGQMHVRKKSGHKIYFNNISLLLTTFIATIALILAALRENADVVHICKAHPMNGLAAWVLHRVRGTRIYLDSDDYEALNNRFSAAWQQRIVAWFENWIPTFSAGITVSNSFIHEHYLARGCNPENIHLVPHGYDSERFSVLDQPEARKIISQLRNFLQIQKKDKIIAYIGSMSLHNHAIDIAIKAFSSLLNDVPNTYLLLVGGGEDLDKLKQQVENLGIADNVRFTSQISSSKIPYYYGLADISIDPKRDTRRAQSSFSIKLIESIAATVPCVASDIGDSRLHLGSAGLLVRPGDIQAMTEAMKSALTDQSLHTSMRENANAIRLKHSWDSRISDFLRVYGK